MAISKDEQALINTMLNEMQAEDDSMEKHYVTSTVRNVVSVVGNISSIANDLSYVARLESKKLKYGARRDLMLEGL